MDIEQKIIEAIHKLQDEEFNKSEVFKIKRSDTLYVAQYIADYLKQPISTVIVESNQIDLEDMIKDMEEKGK